MKHMAKPSPFSPSPAALSGRTTVACGAIKSPLYPLPSEAVDFLEGRDSPLWKRGVRGDFEMDSFDSDKSPSIPLFQRGKSESLLSPGENRQSHSGEEEIRHPIYGGEY